ncbi:MAG: hypothetical protein E6J79_14715 [Deltaproteobacteria bacterium]|nr:MAG: hypothetical protein E6J79_14715 [Deltaproteobacteria bacterium]
MQGELGHEILAVDDVLHALVLLVRRIDDEEDVFTGPRELSERRHHRCLVGVSDVVLAAARAVRPFAGRRQRHLGGVHVGPVLLLGEAEGEDAAVPELLCGAALQGLVAAHPDGAEAEHGDLPGVPVLEAVEREDLPELADPPGVPARLGSAVAGGRAHGREDPLVLHELEKVGVPDPCVVVLLQAALTLPLEERDGPQHHLPRAFVGIRAPVLPGIQEDHAARLL